MRRQVAQRTSVEPSSGMRSVVVSGWAQGGAVPFTR